MITVQKDPERKLFVLSDQDLILIDADRWRRERPISHANDIAMATLGVLDLYDAYQPDEMFQDERYRRLARRNKERVTRMARGILRVAAPEMTLSTDLQDKIAAEATAYLSLIE